MFSFVNRMDSRSFVWVLVFALAGVVLSGMLAPTTVAARDARRPYVIPGDADGPAGVEEAVVIQDRAGSDVVPLCVSLGPWMGGLVAIRVEYAGKVTWMGQISTEAHGVVYPKH